MINFASLFNQFRMGNNSISDLLEAPTTTVDRLLDQDSFPNQFKSGNAKVQQFMKYDKYQTLVKYITEVGPPEDRKRSYKYPITACQVLSCDSNQTLDLFFGDNPIIVKQQVVDNSPPKKSGSQSQNSKNDKSKGSDKVMINEKLDVEETNKQSTSTTEQKTPEKHQQEQGSKSENISQQNKSQQQITQDRANPSMKIVQKQVQPLRHALFSYFKGQVNYTLAGYVCKVFTALFTKKPVAVMRFLLDTQRFRSILNHIQSRSVGQLVVKLLTQQSVELLDQRKVAFQQMLQKMSKNNEVYVISNLSTPICQTIEKVAASLKTGNQSSIQLSQIYFTPAIVTQIISNVMSDEENVSVYNAPILQTYLMNVPLVIPQKSQIIEDLRNLLLSFAIKTLQKLKIARDSRPVLGFGRMKIIQIISFVIKQNILNARELVASLPQFFSVLYKLCTNYQYNNILHNQVVKIIQIALNQPQTSPFLQSFLKDDTLINLLVTQTEEDLKIRAGSGPQKSRRGYIGHLVTICKKLQQYSSKNPLVAAFVQKKQFQKVIQDLVNKQIFQYNKNLAGYSMKRGVKHSILFGKQQVIQQHIKFLAATPAPIYQAEPDPINIEHPDLVEAEKIQIEAAKLQTQQPEKVKQQQQRFDPRFFDTHIQYNVDDLMNDL